MIPELGFGVNTELVTYAVGPKIHQPIANLVPFLGTNGKWKNPNQKKNAKYSHVRLNFMDYNKLGV